jgi:hypothetical protein
MRLPAAGVAAYKNPVLQQLPSWYLIRHVVILGIAVSGEGVVRAVGRLFRAQSPVDPGEHKEAECDRGDHYGRKSAQCHGEQFVKHTGVPRYNIAFRLRLNNPVNTVFC